MKYLILLVFVGMSLVLYAQNLDLKQDSVVFHSVLNYYTSATPTNEQIETQQSDTMVTNIVFKLKSKNIYIKQKYSKKVIVKGRYSSVFQGAGQSVALGEGQTLFMMSDPVLDMITYDQNTSTLMVVYKNKKVRLFGYITEPIKK